MRNTRIAALVVATAFAAAPAIAQDDGSAAAISAECEMLGPELSAEALGQIEDLDQQLQALSCMVGTPRDYTTQLADRPEGGEIRAVDVESAWGTDVVAQGLQESAEAEAAVTGDLQLALENDPEISEFLDTGGYDAASVIGYAIDENGNVTLFVAPSAAAGAAAE